MRAICCAATNAVVLCGAFVWDSSFNVEGATNEEAEETARVIYQGCYDGIERVLASN